MAAEIIKFNTIMTTVISRRTSKDIKESKNNPDNCHDYVKCIKPYKRLMVRIHSSCQKENELKNRNTEQEKYHNILPK